MCCSKNAYVTHSSGAATAAAYVPQCWRKFCSQWKVGLPSGVIFLHERVSPAGRRRLVCLVYHPLWSIHQTRFVEVDSCTSIVLIPATTTKPPVYVSQGMFAYSGPGPAYPAGSLRTRAYAGQVDPVDASHFTVRYEMSGTSHILDGWLRDNDHVELKPR